MTIRAITLDLDDTLWPIWPTIDRAERVLHDWLSERAPRTAQRFPVAAMRALRDVLVSERPGIGHDFIAQRRLTLESALQSSGEDVALAEAALEIFTEQRNTVDLYPGVLAALERLAARFPIAALTNGTADLARIGIRLGEYDSINSHRLIKFTGLFHSIVSGEGIPHKYSQIRFNHPLDLLHFISPAI